MDEQITRVRELVDPASRARQAADLLPRYQAAVTELSRIRREAIEELRAQGKTQAEIAAVMGVSRGRIGQLVKSGPPPERAFLGTDQLTIAVGGKKEGGKDKPGPVVAQEDMQAFIHLRDLCATLKLDAVHEIIHPPGWVDLNRDNLVVICGPRLSPLIAQILGADHNLAFVEDEKGWHLVDRQTGMVYRSPMDDDQPGDIGYLARLPRPDRRGSFLYIAGIHAMGSSGVINYLENNLADVYRSVKTRRFSCLVQCVFDAESREVTESTLVTPLYRFEGA